MITTKIDTLLYLSGKDVQTVCQELDSVAIIREVFALHSGGQTILPDEAYLSWTNERGESARSLNMPGFVGGTVGAVGTKIINGNISNPQHGLPRASGLTLLYDPLTARITCILEGAYISSLRTASVTALATELLQGPDIECMAVIGAGVLAAAHINLLVQRLPRLRSIFLYDVSPERITLLRQELASTLAAHNVLFQAASTAEEAIRPAQLIVPTTTTTDGYIRYDWLQPGSLLVNISLDDPLPEVVHRADLVVVDDWNLIRNDPRRLLGRMYREGTLLGPDEPYDVTKQEVRRVDAQLGEIVTGTKTGRQRPNDIILVNPFGLSLEDVALAACIYQKARDLHLGISLER